MATPTGGLYSHRCRSVTGAADAGRAGAAAVPAPNGALACIPAWFPAGNWSVRSGRGRVEALAPFRAVQPSRQVPKGWMQAGSLSADSDPGKFSEDGGSTRSTARPGCASVRVNPGPKPRLAGSQGRTGRGAARKSRGGKKVARRRSATPRDPANPRFDTPPRLGRDPAWTAEHRSGQSLRVGIGGGRTIQTFVIGLPWFA